MCKCCSSKNYRPKKSRLSHTNAAASACCFARSSPDDVTSVLFDICGYFRELNAKVLYKDELEKLEDRIIMTLCRMEMIFPPGFFTIMVHLVLHLALEAKIGGPVCYRSMYFVERYAVP